MEFEPLIGLIRSGKTGRDQAINRIYHDPNIQEGVKATFYKYGASSTDVPALYNTTIMEFVVTIVRKKEISIEKDLKTYLKGIAKFVWFKSLKDERKHRSQDIDSAYDLSDGETPVDRLMDLENKGLIQKLLSNLGKNCKEVLLLWANGYSMTEIAKSMNYLSEGMARKKKYKCMKSLTAYVGENPSIRDLLIQ